MTQLPDDEERITKRVVYEHETSSRQNRGAIIAITLLVLATLVFIFMQISKKPPRKNRSEWTPPASASTFFRA